MPEPARIAIVQDRDDGLLRLVAEAPLRPTVRAFGDLFAAFAALVAFAPDTVFVVADQFDSEDVGALRALAGAIGGVHVVLVGDADREVALSKSAGRLHGQVLLRPLDRRRVAAALSMVAAPPGSPGPEAFLDLAKGLSDEVNNPLLFAQGHLQLLESMLDPDRDGDALGQLRAAQRGLDRITATMDRIRTLGRARAVREPTAGVDVLALLREAHEVVTADVQGPRPVLHEFVRSDVSAGTVRGDARLLAEAFRAFVQVGVELATIADDAGLLATATDRGVRIRLEFQGLGLGDWQLPRAFEPYHLNRALRGTVHGLALFLVQTVIHAHGGQALARRRDDGAVLLDLLLPAIESPSGS